MVSYSAARRESERIRFLAPVTRAVGTWNFKEINPDQLLGQFNPFNKSVILRINEARNLGDQTRNEFYEKNQDVDGRAARNACNERKAHERTLHYERLRVRRYDQSCRCLVFAAR